MNMKKVSIVVESLKLKKMYNIIHKSKMPGYTIIPDVGGSGQTGRHDIEEVSDACRNSLITIICTPEEADRLTDEVRPIIQRHGGICFVSNVETI